jgi:hypothetical protein
VRADGRLSWGDVRVVVSLGLDVSELRLGWAFVSYDDQRPLALGVEDLRKRDGGYLEEQVITAVREVRALAAEAACRAKDEAIGELLDALDDGEVICRCGERYRGWEEGYR